MSSATIFVDPAGARAADRVALDRPATVRDGDQLAYDAVVRDISATGCLVECDAPVDVGALLSVGLAGIGRMPAHVVRVGDRLLGCAFDRPLAADELVIAGRIETVVRAPLPWDGQRQPIETEVAAPRWPPAARLALMLAGAATGWTAIVLATR